MSVCAAGWFDDPSAPGRSRYWDGRLWTDWVSRDGATELAPLPPRPSAVAEIAAARDQWGGGRVATPPATPSASAAVAYAPVAVALPVAPAAAPSGAVADPQAPYGRDPVNGRALSDKSKVAAGLLQLFLGSFGVGRFYMGSTGIAVAQFILGVLGVLTAVVLIGLVFLTIVGVWAFIDAIVILAGSPVDGEGRLMK